MARITQKVRICDHCGKKQVDDGKQLYGGSLFHSWCALHIENGSTSLEALAAKKDFDFCSIECMQKHF